MLPCAPALVINMVLGRPGRVSTAVPCGSRPRGLHHVCAGKACGTVRCRVVRLLGEESAWPQDLGHTGSSDDHLPVGEQFKLFGEE
jgi:hypothetical protein